MASTIIPKVIESLLLGGFNVPPARVELAAQCLKGTLVDRYHREACY